MTENFEKLTQRLRETVSTSSKDSSLLVEENDEHHTVPVVTKICNILSYHLTNSTTISKQKSCSERCLVTEFDQAQQLWNIHESGNRSLPHSLSTPSKVSNLNASTQDLTMSSADLIECMTEDDGQETSLGNDVYVKQYLAEHESQVVLWEQMTTFRREFIEMRSQVESILTRLHMDFSNMTREASCNFVLLLSQMGCPSCSTGTGLEACAERVKALEAELDKAHVETNVLTSKMESALQMKNQVQDRLNDRESVIQSLTETIDQLQSHCLQLEENSSDGPQWEELIVRLEGALRSIGRLVVDDSDLFGDEVEPQIENEDTSCSTNWINLPQLAESTVTAVRAALSRRRIEIQQLQSAVNESQQRMLQSDQTRGDLETRERAIQRELADLKTQLAEMNHEKQLQKESVQQAERANKVLRLELEEKDRTIRQLQDELHREKGSRKRMEETLDDLRQEEAIQRSSHTELLAEIQQLTCDNQLCRSNIASFEERLQRLRKEMDSVREERTRLTVALDFSKDERNLLIKQLKEMEDKVETLKDQSRNIQLEKMSVEDSLCRLQVLKSMDEAQLKKLNVEVEELRKVTADFEKEKDELNEEVTALKHELVKAEELRMRLESFNSTLEHSLNTANADNAEIKDQLDGLIQINEQLTEKQSAMNQRYSDIEIANNNLTEEIAKLTREFNASKEREVSWKEEVDTLRLKIASLEDDNRDVHQQLLDAQNVNRLTQVSLMATQTNYDEIRVELERVTREMQTIIVEKEELLSELHLLQESTNAAISQLQFEKRQLTQDVNDKCRELQDTLNNKAATIEAKEKEKQELEMRLQGKLNDVLQEHRRHLDAIQAQHSKTVQELQKDMATQVAKLQDLLARKENERQQQATIAQAERKNLQEKLTVCTHDLENERKELAKLREEDKERERQHKASIDEFRMEINRLHSELRDAGESRTKEMQTAEQVLAVTNENLKRSEQDFSAARTELATTNRQLKDAQRQVESLQIQLSKMESQRDEARKEGLQRGGQMEELTTERNELRNSVVSMQATIKRLEADREDVVKCLEDARKRIGVLEENRGVLEREVHHLRTLVKDAEKQVARLTEDLNISQQKLERSQEVQNRWKERSEALVEQLQAEQNRTILAEQAITKYINKIQAIKLHYQQLEQQYSQKVQQSGSQNSIHQQRLDEMDVTVQKTIARSKRLEEERHNFHSRLIEADKEVGILKNRLKDSEKQSLDLTAQMHKLELEKRELNSKFGVLYSTLKRFVRVLEDGHQGNKSFDNPSAGIKFIQPLSSTLESEMSMIRDSSAADPDAIQIILQDLMRHIMQLQARRTADYTPNRDEPTRLDTSSRERHRQLTRQLREADATGIREQLHASLNTVASHVSLGPQTLHRESTRLDGLVANVRRFDSSPIRPEGPA